MLVDDVREPIAANRIVPMEVSAVHMPEFGPSYSGILCPDILDVFQSKGFSGRAGQNL